MAVLVRQSHPNLKYIVYDGQATEWLDDFFERGFSRRGYPTIRVRTPSGDTKYDWSMMIGEDTVSIPRVGVRAAINALTLTVDAEKRDIALYETIKDPRSVWATNAGLPTLEKR